MRSCSCAQPRCCRPAPAARRAKLVRALRPAPAAEQEAQATQGPNWNKVSAAGCRAPTPPRPCAAHHGLRGAVRGTPLPPAAPPTQGPRCPVCWTGSVRQPPERAAGGGAGVAGPGGSGADTSDLLRLSPKCCWRGEPVPARGRVRGRRGGAFPARLLEPGGQGVASRGARAAVSTRVLDRRMQNIAPKMLNVDHML